MIIPALAQLGLMAYGLAGSAADNNKANQMLSDKEQQLQSDMDGEMSKDFLETDQGASAMRQVESNMQKQIKQGDQSLASTGATSEAKIASRSKAHEGYNDAVNKLTGYGTTYRESLRRDYQGQLNQIFSSQMQMQQNKQNSWGAIMQGAGSMTAGLGDLFGEK